MVGRELCWGFTAMPIENTRALYDRVILVLKSYSGKREIELDQMLYRDIGIYGGDGVEIADDLEDAFNVDLEPLIKQHTRVLPAGWLRRLLGKPGPSYTDMTVRELIDYIAEHGSADGGHRL